MLVVVDRRTSEERSFPPCSGTKGKKFLLWSTGRRNRKQGDEDKKARREPAGKTRADASVESTATAAGAPPTRRRSRGRRGRGGPRTPTPLTAERSCRDPQIAITDLAAMTVTVVTWEVVTGNDDVFDRWFVDVHSSGICCNTKYK
ncbi:hypothetical protein BHM03_00060262 [Ensete ventricosum]|nr:hypothetical protein BHM03_00060262 [Ensete ventricosum]